MYFEGYFFLNLCLHHSHTIDACECGVITVEMNYEDMSDNRYRYDNYNNDVIVLIRMIGKIILMMVERKRKRRSIAFR